MMIFASMFVGNAEKRQNGVKNFTVSNMVFIQSYTFAMIKNAMMLSMRGTKVS